jgi:hypothetical protein
LTISSPVLRGKASDLRPSTLGPKALKRLPRFQQSTV